MADIVADVEALLAPLSDVDSAIYLKRAKDALGIVDTDLPPPGEDNDLDYYLNTVITER